MERDDALEAAIDRAGRNRVFARAKFYGWDRYDTPPKWVWWGIVREIEEATTPSEEREDADVEGN